MLLKYRLPLFSVLILTLSFGMIQCTDDDTVAEETVEPSEQDMPATPPEDTMVAPSEATQPVYFAFDDYTLTGDSQGQLSKLAGFLKGSTAAVIQIEGHADERGSIEYNLALGERRAQSVKNYLTQLGVDAGRLTTISYGEEKPAIEGHDESSWSKNRRAQFVVSNP